MHQAFFVVVHALAALLAVRLAGGTAAGALTVLAVAVAVELFDRHRAHRLSPSALDDVPAVALRGVVSAAIATALGFPVFGPGLPAALARIGPMATAALYTAVVVVGVGVANALLGRLRTKGRLVGRSLIVGTSDVGTAIAGRLREHPEYGLVPVGFVDHLPASPVASLALPVLGDVTHLPGVVAEYDIDHVFVAECWLSDDELVQLLRACDRLDCEIFVVPRLFQLGMGGYPAADHLWGIPMTRLNRAPFRCPAWTLKRVFDVVLAAVALLLTSPVMAAIALALRYEVGPDVLFRQVRVGLDGRLFRLVKFRTIAPSRQEGPHAWGAVDPDRVGTVGRFLRRSSLDELPQLWNVLRGEMSLVGPRPELPRYVEEFAEKHDGYRDRLRVPAGMTGWAQIHGLRGATSIDDRVRFDNFYIDHWSLWKDVKILVRTALSVITMRGG